MIQSLRPSTLDQVEEPIRAELFGLERLEQHGETLAAAQRVTTTKLKAKPLLARVADNARVLRETYLSIADSIEKERSISPAAEWLVDNFYVVDDQLQKIRADLPVGFYRELAKLAEGHLAGYPRVYGIAWAFVAHSDSHFDAEALYRFVRAYQRVQPLTVGELWAVAITLRVVLVENLRRLALSVVQRSEAHVNADAVADRLFALTGDPAAQQALLRPFEDAPLTPAFAVELVHRLRDEDPAVSTALTWLKRRLDAQGTTADDVVQLEHQRQAATSVTVRNVITSMRSLSELDWPAFVERVSLVDELLCANSDFAAMDFASRDAYRHAIERIARDSKYSELEVTQAALAQAGQHRGAAGDPRQADPGYALVGGGRAEFERYLAVRPSLSRRVLQACLRRATAGYLGSIALVTAAVLALLLFASSESGTGWAGLVALGLGALIPASDLALSLLNHSITALFVPQLLPRLELREGVPVSLRTMVVVPCMLSNLGAIDELVSELEVHFLANPDVDLRFALLSDWEDAAAKQTPNDQVLLDHARLRMRELNARHVAAPDGGARFLLLHRERKWNEVEHQWMGWERKRGKLQEFNHLLRGDTTTSYLRSEGVVPEHVRYVITLDSDTQLPMGAVRRLVGTMAHPLNRPGFDAQKTRVITGHAVLQPRVMPLLPERRASLFQRLSAGPSGVDPYGGAVSDVYQDLFGEGSYTGKGIYDVDAFEAALEGRVPENAQLSHDLFEGIFARAGLATDIEVFERGPAHYLVATARQHRWARGDWQLLPWVLGSKLPIIGRWKMFDNLRRSLSPVALVLTLVAGWVWPTVPPSVTIAFVLLMVVLPSLLPLLEALMPKGKSISKFSHAKSVLQDLRQASWQVALTIVMLGWQSWLMCDAVFRTLTRITITKRHRLEWVTAAQVQRQAGHLLSVASFYRRMAGALVLPVAVLAGTVALKPTAVWLALPFVLVWGLAPLLARWVSLPRVVARSALPTPEEARALRVIARRTWAYFETFVGAHDQALPPDNFQESPQPVIAHRTSPTNIGLYLLSTVAANDFGWLGLNDTSERIDATLDSISRLEHFRGHLFNWYDTRDGRPLEPRYVSSVDSGNLAGSLLALGNACRELATRQDFGHRARAGVEDTAALIRAAAAQWPAHEGLTRALDALAWPATAPEPNTLAAWAACLTQLREGAEAVSVQVQGLVEHHTMANTAPLLVWAGALKACVASHARDLESTQVNDRLLTAAARSRAMTMAMDFTFLFDPVRKLFSLGWRMNEATLDAGRYDLLASEARLMSFVAIAKSDAPHRTGFAWGGP